MAFWSGLHGSFRHWGGSGFWHHWSVEQSCRMNGWLRVCRMMAMAAGRAGLVWAPTFWAVYYLFRFVGTWIEWEKRRWYAMLGLTSSWSHCPGRKSYLQHPMFALFACPPTTECLAITRLWHATTSTVGAFAFGLILSGLKNIWPFIGVVSQGRNFPRYLPWVSSQCLISPPPLYTSSYNSIDTKKTLPTSTHARSKSDTKFTSKTGLGCKLVDIEILLLIKVLGGKAKI